MTDNRRTRVQSLPASSHPSDLKDQHIFESDIEEEDNFEADDETSQITSRRPSTVAKEEIAQARRLNERISGNGNISINNPSPNLSSVSSVQSSTGGSKTSLFGSLYSLGGAVLSFIRGPVDTDSNEELIETRRHRSQSFSVPSPTTTSKRVPLHQTADSDDSIHTDSSEAPNFNLPQELESPKSHSSHNMRSTAEPGRDKILFKECQEDTCNLIGRDFPQEEYLLSSKDVSSIQSQIPARWNVYTDWILLYSTRGNGFSLTTLYHQLRPFKGPVLISVKDEFGSIFGAFVNQSLQPRQGHYGNGECFLWRKNTPSTFIKYPSTGKNNYFVICEPEYLAIGCGGGKFGLWLEKELFKGISDPVPTFDNEQLSTNEKFDCIAIEIWGLDLNE